MRLFLMSIILLAVSANTGDARHMSLECNKDREGKKWHERICCLLSNNQYEEIAGNSCPNIQGRCGAGEMECAGPGPGTRCVPRGQCNPMRSSRASSFLNWFKPRLILENKCRSNDDCGKNGMPSGICAENGKCMMYAKAPISPTATEPKNMTPCINEKTDDPVKAPSKKEGLCPPKNTQICERLKTAGLMNEEQYNLCMKPQDCGKSD